MEGTYWKKNVSGKHRLIDPILICDLSFKWEKHKPCAQIWLDGVSFLATALYYCFLYKKKVCDFMTDLLPSRRREMKKAKLNESVSTQTGKVKDVGCSYLSISTCVPPGVWVVSVCHVSNQSWECLGSWGRMKTRKKSENTICPLCISGFYLWGFNQPQFEYIWGKNGYIHGDMYYTIGFPVVRFVLNMYRLFPYTFF